MDREEIYEMVFQEMMETAVRERNEHSPEDQGLQDKVARLSKEMQEKIKDLPEDVKKAITDYDLLLGERRSYWICRVTVLVFIFSFFKRVYTAWPFV